MSDYELNVILEILKFRKANSLVGIPYNCKRKDLDNINQKLKLAGLDSYIEDEYDTASDVRLNIYWKKQ